MRDDTRKTSAGGRREPSRVHRGDPDEVPTLTEALGNADADRPARDHPSLTLMSGDDTGKLVRIGDGELSVGRGADADLRLTEESVSLRHARFFRIDEQVYVQDLQSRNGTWVGGKRIESPLRLQDGDHVRIGSDSELMFNLKSAAEEEAAEQLYESAVRDPTSGAYNRRHFEHRFEAERALAQRRGYPFVLLLLDIDEFKAMNDAHGHVFGDVVLRIVTSNVQRLLRPEDTLVRFGGDEFVVFCRDMTLRNGLILAERIRMSVDRLPLSVRGNDVHVTVSVGVAAAGNDDAAWDSLLESADHALYAAKHAGRNLVSRAG
ncbi:MAG: GGDEF domain-containing protein [Myxococcales bacterium]|nr:GGDEF domain-containing protein [Myxococcales bacterium]